jgi:tetratricopeptide (TPR) repeat protein
MSKIYESEGNIPMAIKAYRFMIKKDSLQLSNRKNLARIYMNNRLYSDADKQLTQIIQINENDINSLINLAETNLYLKLQGYRIVFNDPQEIIDKVVGLDSLNMNARKLRARLYYDEKRYKEAVMDLEFIKKVIDLNEYYYNILGISYMNIDSFDLAEDYLKKSFSAKEYRSMAIII